MTNTPSKEDMVNLAETHVRSSRYLFLASAGPLLFLLSQVNLVAGGAGLASKLLYTAAGLAFAFGALIWGISLTTRYVDETDLKTEIAVGTVTDANAVVRYHAIKKANGDAPQSLANAALVSTGCGYLLTAILMFTLVWFG